MVWCGGWCKPIIVFSLAQAEQKSGILICDVCEFEAKNANGLNMHKKAKHTINN